MSTRRGQETDGDGVQSIVLVFSSLILCCWLVCDVKEQVIDRRRVGSVRCIVVIVSSVIETLLLGTARVSRSLWLLLLLKCVMRTQQTRLCLLYEPITH